MRSFQSILAVTADISALVQAVESLLFIGIT
jgi:hypothetical protein